MVAGWLALAGCCCWAGTLEHTEHRTQTPGIPGIRFFFSSLFCVSSLVLGVTCVTHNRQTTDPIPPEFFLVRCGLLLLCVCVCGFLFITHGRTERTVQEQQLSAAATRRRGDGGVSCLLVYIHDGSEDRPTTSMGRRARPLPRSPLLWAAADDDDGRGVVPQQLQRAGLLHE